jgi:hypothetical protein
VPLFLYSNKSNACPPLFRDSIIFFAFDILKIYLTETGSSYNDPTFPGLRPAALVTPVGIRTGPESEQSREPGETLPDEYLNEGGIKRG